MLFYRPVLIPEDNSLEDKTGITRAHFDQA